MTYDLSRFVSALTFPAIPMPPWGRNGFRFVRSGGAMLGLLFALATVVPIATQAEEGYRRRPVIAAALTVSSPDQKYWIATSAIPRANCCLESSAISTAALTESRTQSETRCATSEIGTYCVRTRTVETSTNDVQMEFFPVGADSAKVAMNGKKVVLISSMDQADIWRAYSDVLARASNQSGPELATGGDEFNDGNSRSLALRFNSAVYDIVDYSAQRPINGWRPQYYASPLYEGMIAAVTPRYQINEFAVSQGTVISVSATAGPAGERSSRGSRGDPSGGGGTPGQTVNDITPMQRNSLLGSPVGNANDDYETRLRVFGQAYIPAAPRPAPNK
jgi:hypothetical protein